MSLSLSLSLSLYLSISLSLYLSVSLSVYLSISLSLYLSISLSLYLSIYLSIYISLSIHIYIYIYDIVVYYSLVYYTILYYTILYYTIVSIVHPCSRPSGRSLQAQRRQHVCLHAGLVHVKCACVPVLLELRRSCSYPCPNKFYRLPAVLVCYTCLFYKLSWAWAWV